MIEDEAVIAEMASFRESNDFEESYGQCHATALDRFTRGRKGHE
jgi:hypothetical protein